MFNPIIRSSWDKSLKKVAKLEETSHSFAYIYHTYFKSPIVLISEREFIEKRVEIIEPKYAILFGFSVPNNVVAENKKVIRCTNFYNCHIIEERNDYWLMTTITQSDLKMPIPENFLNFTLPMKFNGWYNEYMKFFKKKK